MLKASEADLIVRLMTHDDQQFFKELGARIAQLRKEAGLSQQAVADALEIPQQTYANYEVARGRPSRCCPPSRNCSASASMSSWGCTRTAPPSADPRRFCRSRSSD